jgi:hypothetical protein
MGDQAMAINTVMTIGTYYLTKDTDFDVPQEYAGASQTVRVAAGDYPVEIRRDDHGRRYVSIPLPGTLIYDAFYNRIGAFGSMKVEHPMTAFTHHVQPYAYVLEQMAVRGDVTLSVPRTEWNVYGV